MALFSKRSRKLLTFLLSLLGFIIGNLEGADTKTETEKKLEILKRILDPSKYHKNVRAKDGAEPVQVGIAIHLLFLPQFDTVARTMTLSMYFRQNWTDPRLNFEDSGFNKTITLSGPGDATKIWVPDTVFENEIKSDFHFMTTPHMLTRISPNGQTQRAYRITTVFSCPMTSNPFPFGDQVCPITIGSFSLTSQDIVYTWAKGQVMSLGVSSKFQNPRVAVVGHQLTSTDLSLSTGDYSELSAYLWIRPNSAHFLIEFFWPCIFFNCVALSALLLVDPRVVVMVNIATMGMTILFLAMSSGLQEIHKVFPDSPLIFFTKIVYIFILLSLATSFINFHLTIPAPNNDGSRGDNIKLRNLSPDESEDQRQLSRELGDDETNLCQPSSASVLKSEQKNGPLLVKLQFTMNTLKRIMVKILPIWKLCLIVSFIVTHFVYWSHYPASPSEVTPDHHGTVDPNKWIFLEAPKY